MTYRLSLPEEQRPSETLTLLPPVSEAEVAQELPRPASNENAAPRLSIVAPAMNEEGNIADLYAAIAAAVEPLGVTWELVLIDDGSSDGTWRVMNELVARDARVVALRHRRNFGKARGLATGFAIARGDVVITMDADLQDDPEEIARFLAMLDEGYDLVSGWKQRRQDPLGKTMPSRVFNATVRRVSGVPLHDFNCGFKAYRAEVTQNIRLYGELHRFTPVLANAEGFRVGELPVKHHARRWGSSKYGWSRLVKGFLDLLTVTFLTQYRQRPMHMLGIPGLAAITVGVLIGLWLTSEKLITGAAIGGRPLLLLAVLLVLVGVQFFGIGLLGELFVHGSQADLGRGKATPLREVAGLGAERLERAGLYVPAAS
ncbi:MAG: glycosyltransferase family 2 protein [Thermomicrobiales bacterium]|nr:glycosyltransferase family 2 protein [Thermomicrobiales bacterium]